ncbi:MAG: carboxypeptidase-like regulatory domain-containing protein [Cyclobacteriaceae bacterium]|nr:carboxypeptidase-like regulatory domain-containing protein [Cyclobacteriaceae bacterium]
MRYLFILIILMPFYVHANQITGQIKDYTTGKLIQGAEIFIDRSMVKAVSDENGYFILDDLNPGQFKLVCTKNGYESIQIDFKIKEGENLVLFRLKKEKRKKLKNKDLQERIISRLINHNSLFPEWSTSCRFKASSLVHEYDSVISGRMVFDNDNLGYRITCHFFNYTADNPVVLYYFYPLVAGNDQQKQQWEDNRYMRHQLTVNNFLEAVLQNTTSLHGYQVLDEERHIASLVPPVLKIGFSNEPNTLYPQQPLIIHYSYSGQMYESTIYTKDSVLFSDYGLILNPANVRLEGVFSKGSLAEMLPIEYSPPLDKKYFNISSYFEKAYLHTDKPYYFPGDTVWFKGYINYANLTLIESLSKVLYVEFIDQHNGGRIIQECILKINDGLTHGEFIIPDSITSDYFALRAYTLWQQNFGSDQVFINYYPILSRSDNLIDSRGVLQPNNQVQVYFPKLNFNTREKIRMGIAVTNEDEKPVSAWMSVSVTDKTMVRSLDGAPTILNQYPIKPFDEPGRMLHEIEKGISINGAFLNHQEKPTMASIVFSSDKLGQTFEFETDLDGQFYISGLDFTDSATVVYRAKSGKVPLYGTIKLRDRTPLPLQLNWPAKIQNVERADFKIDKNTTLLNEVVVKAKRIVEEESVRKKEETIFRPWGYPAYSYTPDKLNQAAVNVFEMLRGRVPGLMITNDGMSYIAKFTRSRSYSLNTEPAYFLDDQPVVRDAIQSINPFDVAMIELMATVSPILGASGGNGVIAVYTKTGGLRGKFETDSDFKTFGVKGYTTTRNFIGINHITDFIPQESDYRTTLFWAPQVIYKINHGPAWLEFFASDSTGPYLITIEGVTSEGKPFRDERLIQLNEKEDQ